MIFIVSLILTFGFALSAVFIGFGPNAYRLSDKDFMSRAVQNAELEAMQYGDLYLHAGKLNPDNVTAPNKTTMESLFAYSVTPQSTVSISITSEITVNKDSDGVKTITAKAYTHK